MIKPLLFGYARLAVEPSPTTPDLATERTNMFRFAHREGFTLAQVFVDASAGPPWTALESLLEATRYTVVAAILVPERAHLGADNATQDATRERIQATSGSPVITMRLPPSQLTNRDIA